MALLPSSTRLKAAALAAVLAGLTVIALPASSVVRPAGADSGPATLVWERRFPGVAFGESSPVAANLGGASYAVGGLDGRLYAFDAATGADKPGWPVATPTAINSSPAAADVTGAGTDQLFVGSGAWQAHCSGGGVYSFSANGAARWIFQGHDPVCANEAFQSSPAIGSLGGDGAARVTIGALGLYGWSLSAAGGGVASGWPLFQGDTVYSSPALADLTGGGAADVVLGGDADPTDGMGIRGGILRAVNGNGQVLWRYITDDIVRSSPAIGDIDGNGRPTIVTGVGDYWVRQPGGATDSTKVIAVDTAGHLRWKRDVGGYTMGSPALADVTGTGHAQVVIGTFAGPMPGLVWVLDGNGNPLPGWAGKPSGGGVVVGGITTADVNNDGAQDLFVPTGAGIFVYDGRTTGLLFTLDIGQVGFQNSPLLTDDGGGALGITIAGTTPGGVGVVQHWRVAGGHLGANGWPTFHHDARRTGNLVPPPLSVNICPPAGGGGYWLTSRDGGVFNYCDATFHGSGGHFPVVGMASSRSGLGYWLTGADGNVASFGDAPNRGSVPVALNRPIVGMASTPSGQGYWLVATDGGIFNFGDAKYFGSTGAIRLNRPIVGMTSTPSGQGYWLVASDGGIFNYGDAAFLGSTGAITLNRPIVGMTSTPSGQGYWLVASDGGIFSYGDARFFGSTGAIHLNQPVVGMARTQAGGGYWFVAADGGVFNYGDARFLGSAGSLLLTQPVVGLTRPGW